jgi:hypothetical protein
MRKGKCILTGRMELAKEKIIGVRSIATYAEYFDEVVELT